MVRLLFLISPVFVSFFWALALIVDGRKYPAPRRFLAIFLLFTALIFLAHFFYFAPYPAIYPWFDVPLQWVAMFIFPLFHIYFRLLTADKQLSFRTHAKYLVIPFVVGLNYFIAVAIAPSDDYMAWLYKGHGIPAPPQVHYLEFSRMLIRIVFPFLLIHSLVANYLLIKKFGKRMEEFFTNVHDRKNWNARILNGSVLCLSLVSLVITTIGRNHVMVNDRYIYYGWTAFSGTLYVLGLLGMRQLPINPTHYLTTVEHGIPEGPEPPVTIMNDLAEKIRTEFERNKIHLNSELNIMDVAKAVGTNRSYISSTINKRFNQNFSTYVNGYRIREFKRVLEGDEKISIEALANGCGFGSVNSMKRAILLQTGLTFPAMRKKIRAES